MQRVEANVSARITHGLVLWLCAVACLVLFSGCAPKKPVKLTMPEEGEPLHYTPPKPYSWTLPNGMEVLYLEDNELPLVKGALYIKGGSLWQNDKEYAVASLMGPMLRKGGAGDLSADELDTRLEQLAASIGSEMSGQYGSVSFECLAEDVEEVFGLFSDVLLRPRFQADRLKLLKGQVLEGISRRKDDPWTMAAVSFRSLVYGNSALGRTLTSSQVKKVQPWKLQKEYLKFLRPERSVFIISGAVPIEKVKKLLEKEFVHLKPAKKELPELSPVFPSKAAKVVYIPSELAQATIIVGQRGVPIYTKDHFPILLYNEIFSGGMSSLLFKTIRSELGLAYSVFGAISPGFIAGKNLVAIQTKAASAGEAIVSAIDTLKMTQKEKVSPELLNDKRKGMSASYVFSHASPWSILNRQVSLDISGYPENYDEIYLDKLQAVTAEDVRQVAENRWQEDKLIILLVGNKEAYNSFLKVRKKLPGIYGQLPVELGSFNEKLSF